MSEFVIAECQRCGAGVPDGRDHCVWCRRERRLELRRSLTETVLRECRDRSAVQIEVAIVEDDYGEESWP